MPMITWHKLRCFGPACSVFIFAFIVVCPMLGVPKRAQAENNPPVFIANAQVVDIKNKRIVPTGLLLERGVIAAHMKKAPFGFKGRVYDVRNRWVIPSFKDMHVHGWGNPSATGQDDDDECHYRVSLQRMLRAGVTHALDLAGDEAEVFKVRNQQRAHPRFDEAKLYTAAMPIMYRRGSDESGGVHSATEARQKVAELAAKHVDVIKIFNDRNHKRNFALDVLRALVQEAKAHKLATVVHIGTWADADDAVAVGATAITHLDDDALISATLAQRIATAGTLLIPTMAVQCDLRAFALNPRLLESPLLRAVAPVALLERYRHTAHYAARVSKRVAYEQTCEQHDVPSLARLSQAGVTIVAGSDTGNLGTFQGYSLHRELWWMVSAGVDPWTALAAATTLAASLIDGRFGIEVGDEASLVVLSASPIDDIRHTERIEAVFLDGKKTK